MKIYEKKLMRDGLAAEMSWVRISEPLECFPRKRKLKLAFLTSLTVVIRH
jgi:hypothetical protein